MKKVLAGGCFNKLHEGHVYFLKEAGKHGDHLVVVLAHQLHNKKLHAVGMDERLKNMKKTGLADEVIVGDPKDYMKIVKKTKPDVICLGYDQELPVPKSKLGKIKVVKINKFGEFRTRNR